MTGFSLAVASWAIASWTVKSFWTLKLQLTELRRVLYAVISNLAEAANLKKTKLLTIMLGSHERHKYKRKRVEIQVWTDQTQETENFSFSFPYIIHKCEQGKRKRKVKKTKQNKTKNTGFIGSMPPRLSKNPWAAAAHLTFLVIALCMCTLLSK